MTSVKFRAILALTLLTQLALFFGKLQALIGMVPGR